MESKDSQWPFDAPKNQACLSSRHVFQGDRICHVYHDWEDGGWQFLPDRHTASADAMVVGLEQVFKLDSSIGALADLPEGWKAVRQEAGGWIRERCHPYPVYADDGYYLIPVACFPTHYTNVPSETVRSSLRQGDIVKLAFRFADENAPASDDDTERMWVIVEEVNTDEGIYRGTLDNDPRLDKVIVHGHRVTFNQRHVLAIAETC